MKVEINTTKLKSDLSESEVGDVFVVTKGLSHVDFPTTLLRTFSGWVSLENPSNTWLDLSKPNSHFGHKLPKGTKITLTVE